MAGIAERLLDLETGETVPEGRTLPVDSELCKLVEVFDDRNAATRAETITRYKAVGVSGEGRSKRKRLVVFFFCASETVPVAGAAMAAACAPVLSLPPESCVCCLLCGVCVTLCDTTDTPDSHSWGGWVESL